MRTLYATLLAAFVLLLSACGNNTYYLTTDDAHGISIGDEVQRQGIVIGEVAAVRFVGSEVHVEISTHEPLFEGQGFAIRDDADGRYLALSRPHEDAEVLADGATIEQKWTAPEFVNGLEHFGSNLTRALEDAFGRDGEKLENSLERAAERFGEKAEAWGEALEKWAEENEEEIEAWAESLESEATHSDESTQGWAKKNEQDFQALSRKLKRWSQQNEAEFRAFSDEVDRWAEDFEGNMDDFIRELDRVSDQHKVGSDAWKQEMKQVLKELK